jgi:putative endopeptidase
MALSASDRDPSADPGVDFYRFANGGWLDANPIPAGYGSWGAFEEVGRRNELALRELLERAAETPGDLLGDAFAAGLDLDAIEAAGLEPIAPLLREIECAQDQWAVLALLPKLHRAGIFALFGWGVTVDHDDSDRYLLWLVQAGLGLGDRERYFDPSDAAVELRAAYVEHVAAQLAHVGFGAERAGSVLEFEKQLAGLHLKGEERRDVERTHNRYTRSELAMLAPELSLASHLSALGAGAAASVNVENTRLFEELEEVVATTAPATLRAYLAFTVVRTLANALPKHIDDEDFAFYGRRIKGQTEQHERTKRVIDAIGEDLGEALAERYVAANFAPEAKERAAAMVAAIVEEMRASIRTREWMSPETRQQAEVKLDAIRVKIGYPDRWRDWSGLELGRTTYAANRLKATRFELDRQLAKLTEPVDRGEWEMPAHIVNAYYHPSLNEIVVPAGILQPPLFDAEADDAVNFGGIGMVIAHEITHGFDDQGRRFDADGALREWWTAEDAERFNALAEKLVDQFAAYTVLDGVAVNGRLTLGENIADLGGVKMSYRAMVGMIEKQHGGNTGKPEFTPAQEYFLGFAQSWCGKMRDEALRHQVATNPHSPPSLRVNGPLSNLPEFAQAFSCKPGQKMVRQDRCEVW